MTAESFALAAIVVVCGVLGTLFVVDGLLSKAPRPNKSGWLRKWRKRLKKYRILWTIPVLGLGGWAAYSFLLDVSGNAPTAIPGVTATNPRAPAAAPQQPLIAAPAQADPQASSTPTVQFSTQESSDLEAQRDVAVAVENWRSAWANRDIDTYLEAYAPDFKPADGLALDVWRKQRQERLGQAKDIQVEVVDPTMEVKGETATVRFQQRYKAGKYADQMLKQLTLERFGGKWQITEERRELSKRQ